MPTQLEGAKFLAQRHRALLADEPRVGKTGAAIIAADMILANKIDVVTTASGRAVWRRGFDTWSKMGRSVAIVGVDKDAEAADVRILSYQGTINFNNKRKSDLVILDESHFIKNPIAKRTEAILGREVSWGTNVIQGNALVQPDTQCWFLTGTPIPHDPGDLYTTMRTICSDRLLANPWKKWPDVSSFDTFRDRYCIVKMKKISNWNKIPVVIGGRNVDELKDRLDGHYLRRTQKDIGIRPPAYDLFPFVADQKILDMVDGDLDKHEIVNAAIEGSTKDLDMHLGPLRRLTGTIKAELAVNAVNDEFESGLDKIVLMYWHRDVGDILQAKLAKYNPLRIDGSTSSKDREAAETAFRTSNRHRVMLGQIQAAGEAIDLSAASVLWFIETSFSPKDQAQAAMRITNVNQTQNTYVRVCCIEGSIDEAVQAALMRLWTAIKGVMK
jgi:SNF2 family DNA or RNA helicase